MIRRSISTLSLLLVAAAPLTAQLPTNRDPDKNVAGGPLPAGRMARTDRPDQKIQDAKFVVMGKGYQVSSGPAAIYWTEKTRMTGPFTGSATFRQTKNPMHPEAYGIFFEGNKLDAPDQTYSYLLVRGDGKILLNHRAGSDVRKIIDWTDNAAVHKADANGVATNTVSVDATKPDSVRLLVNGVQVAALPGAKAGSTDGYVGLRVNHNLDVQISDFVVAPKKK
jgi:hypothetical protein